MQDTKHPRTGKELRVQCSLIRSDGHALLNRRALHADRACDMAVRGGPRSVETAGVHSFETSLNFSARQYS